MLGTFYEVPPLCHYAANCDILWRPLKIRWVAAGSSSNNTRVGIRERLGPGVEYTKFLNVYSTENQFLVCMARNADARKRLL